MGAPLCQNCGGSEWTTRGLPDDRGRCATCREFPTLGWLVGNWTQAHCVIPDRVVAGRPFKLSDQQYLHLLRQFRLKPTASYDEDKPAAPFFYVGALIVRSQKWGKGPFSASRICAQAVGPVLFAGWAEGGETFSCKTHGCSCGWTYTYKPGEAMGVGWAAPHIQVAAVAEDQTDNIWRALKPMIELGPLAESIPDTGLDRINLPDGGIIEPVSSNATTRLGARIVYVEIDQPESMTKRNGGEDLVDVLLRNVSGMGGRWSATGNAHDPTEGSVQQTWVDKPGDDVLVDFPDPPSGSWKNKRERRKILKFAYAGSPWVDIDRIESDCDRLERKGDPGQAERFFGCRVVAGASKAFDKKLYEKLETDFILAPGRLVTAGFDGSLAEDHTGLVVEDVATGFQAVVAWWKRPEEYADDDSWRVPIAEVDEAVELVFDTWDVWRLYGDPPRYRDDMNRWAGLYGAERIIEWWTSDRKKTALGLREYKAEMRPGVMSHGPLRLKDESASDEALTNHAGLIEHVGNAVKRLTNMRDEDDEDRPFLWLIGKESPRSPKKIDLAVCSLLARIAGGHARRGGALNVENYGRAQWSGGQAKSAATPERSDYVPCKGCEKPIHPRLHATGAPERGRCMKCRAKSGAVTSARW